MRFAAGLANLEIQQPHSRRRVKIPNYQPLSEQNKMNIIKRIGVAFDLVVFGNLSTGQAKDLIPLIKSAWPGIPPFSNPEHWEELQRRSQKLAYIEGCGYDLKQPANPLLQAPVKPLPEPDEAPVRRDGQDRWKHGVVEDAVLRSIDRLQKKRFISGDVWAEYVRAKEPMTTRETVLACVSIMARRGLIQQCNPPRKIGNSFVYEKQ